METNGKEKLTVNTVVDDVVGGLLTGIGVVTASILIAYANGKVNSTNKLVPYAISTGAIALGTGARIASNFVGNKKVKEGIKDFANGVTAAGSLGVAVKALKEFAPSLLPAEVQAAIPPQLSGGERVESFSQAVIPSLYGDFDRLNGYQEANVVGSSLLN
jgi:hypothetical protein